MVKDCKLFTVLYQGPKIWNSLPISITSSSSFITFKTKMLQFLSVKSWIDQAALTQHHIFYLLMTAKVASLISLVVSWGLLAIIVNSIISSFFILLGQINKWKKNDENKNKLIQWKTFVDSVGVGLRVPIWIWRLLFSNWHPLSSWNQWTLFIQPIYSWEWYIIQ